MTDEHHHGEYHRMYSKVGYDFIENIRTSHPNFIINQTRLTLLFYSVVACTVVMYVVYYFTTYTYELTNNPKPLIRSMFQHYPCDYAVIQNRWTGRETVIEVAPLEKVDPAASSSDVVDRTPSRKTIYINSLMHRIYLYVQKSQCVVQWDAAKELVPDRFISKKLLHNVEAENLHSSRATVAVRRRDQLLTSPTEAAPQKRALVPPHRTGGQQEQQREASARAPAPLGAHKMPRLLITSTVRAQDKKNGDLQGNLPAYEERIKTVLQDLLVSRYYDCIFRQKVRPGTNSVFAREMVANGTVDGTGVSWKDVVPSLDTVEAEVRQRLEAMMGRDIIIYDFHISPLFK
ncbi:hypothetical protein STCU_08406 [Strigomonas culicis]|uniref:Uncharacterized protein n=1 Tax=Strigomonas culicis TaxID=28005 RepID=S9TZF2_9TRYP|nr:hypothetical protein STCU_08406 [Strigomonas culicis]|eukprot:EPY21984.1 hypothetical protein STCU_08406 [Strigomonas culicis]